MSLRNETVHRKRTTHSHRVSMHDTSEFRGLHRWVIQSRSSWDRVTFKKNPFPDAKKTYQLGDTHIAVTKAGNIIVREGSQYYTAGTQADFYKVVPKKS